MRPMSERGRPIAEPRRETSHHDATIAKRPPPRHEKSPSAARPRARAAGVRRRSRGGCARSPGGRAGADAGSLTVAGESLVAIHDWTFLLGPGFCVGVNGLLLGYLFYRSGLVPRWIAMFGPLVPPDLCFGDRRAVRRLRARRGALPLFDPGDRLRGVDHHLPHRQGLQAVSDPRRHPVCGSGPRLRERSSGCAVIASVVMH